jgi:ATP-binding cassette subfamily F protein 3
MSVLTEEKAAVEAALGTGSLPPSQLAEHGRRLKQLGDEVERLEGRWLELSTEIEGMVAG